MEKTFVNVLAHSRALKLLTVLVLTSIVVIDALAIALVVRAVDYASPENRARMIWMLVLLLISSAPGFPVLYLIRRALLDHWMKTDDRGIAYNSWAKKVSVSWDEVTGVSIVSRGRYGQALRSKALRMDTAKGTFYALPTFVDKSMPIPQLKPGISTQRLSYPNGEIREINVQNSDIYLELQDRIPDLLETSLGDKV